MTPRKWDVSQYAYPCFDWNSLMKRNTGTLRAAILLGILTGFTNLKVDALQPIDFVLLFLLGFCVWKFIGSGLSFRISDALAGLFWSYGLLLLALFLLSVLALRLNFYPINEASFLKRPVIFSLSKLLQFAAIVGGFFWLTNVFMRHKGHLASALTAYWLTGICCSWYAIVSYVALSIVHFEAPDIFGAYSNIEGVVRARGFFNEGGPFGLYLISVFVVGVLRRRMSGRRLGVVNAAILSIAFLLSASKAGVVVAVLLGVCYLVVSAASVKKWVFYFLLATATISVVAVWLDLGNQLLGYFISYQNIEEEIAVRGTDDYNLVVGRISALYIVPRMVVAHPLTGIGFGNYPLMRNDPDYLGFLPTVTEVEDLPGLGIPGIAAEMGIPVTLWLVALLFTPYWMSRGRSATLSVAALVQPVAHIFAVQLTFFYPWFVSACVLAALHREVPFESCAGHGVIDSPLAPGLAP